MARCWGMATVARAGRTDDRHASRTPPSSAGQQGGAATPTIGVVMPAYNAAAFIDAALAGVAGQSRLPTEVVVVDDASSDDTAERARRWERHLPVQVVRLAHNVGSGTARRLAVDTLSTDLVAPLDADDVWLPDHLARLAELHRAHGGVASARAWVWSPGCPRVDYHQALGVRATAPASARRRAQLAAILADNFVFFGTLFAKADYDRVGGFGPERGWEDWDLWVRMVAAGASVSVADQPTVLYRRHGANLTNNAEAFDQAMLDAVLRYRADHPEWLSARQWASVLRHRRAALHLHRATAQLRRHELGGVGELARGASGGWRTWRQVARLATSRTAETLRQGAGPTFR